MEEFYVAEADLAGMQTIAVVSSRDETKERWTELSLHHRSGWERPFVAVVKGCEPTGTFSFKSTTARTLEVAAGFFGNSALTRTIRRQAEEWGGPGEQAHGGISQAAEDALAKALCLLDSFGIEGLGHTYGNGQAIYADKSCAEIAEAFGVDFEPGWYRKVAAIAAGRQN